jgi:hypothetical protein
MAIETKAKTAFFDRSDNEPVVFGEQQLTGKMTVPAPITDEQYREFLAGRLANRVLFNQGPDGFSLIESDVAPGTHVLRHKHNLPQLILIVEGSMRQGNRILGPGAGYFTPADTAYAFVAGPEGCRYVEFRQGAVEDITTDIVESNPDRLVHDS